MSNPVILDRYEMIRPLGHGSMGQVWLGRDRLLPRHVVIKRMQGHIAAQAHYRALFHREMQLMARFRHPCAVELYDTAPDELLGPCMILEYVPGTSGDTLLAREKRLGLDRLGSLVLPLCQALHAAHASGLIHRDLKPANLMITQPGQPEESLKVMDLGLAQLATTPHISLQRLRGSEEPFVAGTPAYICPELLRGDVADHRGDLYAVGLILYEALAGRHPFGVADADSLLRDHVVTPPPALRNLGVAIPDALERLVLQCLAKFPSERPASALEIASRFLAVLGRGADLDRRDFEPRPLEPRAAPGPRPEPGPQLQATLEAWMPEPIAVMKLRGFIDDVRGRVVASEPGLIQVRLGEVAPSAKPRGWARWLPHPTGAAESAPALPPIAIDLHLARNAPPHQAHRVDVTVIFRPLQGPWPRDPRWHERCEELLGQLRGYLMASR